MASPQKENGFTAIANEILDEIAMRKLNGTQYRIIMVVWRYTYGFRRKSHEFSLNFLVETTGLSKDSIKKELKNLIKKKVLVVVQEASFNQARQIAFNKNYDEWEIQRSEIMPQGDDSTRGGKLSHPTGGEKSPSQGDNYPTPQGDNSPPIKIKDKENIKEKIKENIEEEKEVQEETEMTPERFFEENGFGTLNETVGNEIGFWVDKGCFDEPNAVIIEAMKEAIRNDAKKLSYVSKILIDWSEHNVRTLKDAKAYIEHWKNRKRRNPIGKMNQNQEPVPKWMSDPDWGKTETSEEEIQKRVKELDSLLSNL